jgi:UvrD-like helicase family protein
MRVLGVPGSKFKIDTIASWALRVCLAYPKSSIWAIAHPAGPQWNTLYNSCALLLSRDFVKRIVRVSYAGIFVDEYQDCSSSQHAMICALAAILPCTILGDPLQGIFDFADKTVNWPQDVYPSFICLGELTEPWRWRNAGAHELGEWLKVLRQKLELGEQIHLLGQLPTGVTVHFTPSADQQLKKQQTVCRSFSLENGEKAIAIHKGSGEFKNKGHKLARQVSGRFSSIEEIEGVALSAFIRRISISQTAGKCLKATIGFAESCVTKVGPTLPLGTKRGEQVSITSRTKNTAVALAANTYLATPCSANLRFFLATLREVPGVRTFRRDLMNRMMQVLAIHSANPGLSLEEAASKYQRQFRHSGRPVSYPKLIGTTLLVKGLEFDHAIVLDAASLSRKELYVALTRGSKSLTIISSSVTLPVRW